MNQDEKAEDIRAVYRNNLPFTWPEFIFGLIAGIILGAFISIGHIGWITSSLIIFPLTFFVGGIFLQKQVNSVDFVGGWSLGFASIISIIVYHSTLPIPIAIILATLYMLVCMGSITFAFWIVDIISDKIGLKK